MEYQTAVHLGIKGEVKVVQGVVWIAEGGVFPPALQQTLAAPVQLVG